MGCRARPMWREHSFIRSLIVLPQAADGSDNWDGRGELLFVGDDWAEDHHDVELMDAAGRCWPRRGCRRGWPGWPGCTS